MMSLNRLNLDAIDFFAELNPEELAMVRSVANIQKVREADIITHRNTPAHTFFIVLSGNFMIAYDKGRAITIHQRGEIIGWSSLVTPFRFKGTVTALTDGEVLRLPAEKLLELIQKDPELANKIMKKVDRIASERTKFIDKAPAGK